jgi:hypothetical protein
MQDEVTKHTKKIYDTVKNPKQSFGEKIKEIIVEIFIIVFAVTLSIWLHSWSEHRHEKSEAREFLTDLKEDLNNDIKSKQIAKQTLAQNLNNFTFIEFLTKEKIDSLEKRKTSYGFNASIGTTKVNNGNYEGFKSSGKIGFIENKDLKKDILRYYQDVSPSVLEIEKINASQLLKISDFMTENAEQDIKARILNPKFKAMIEGFQSYAKSNLKAYEEAIDLAKQIIIEIDKQE